MSQIILLSTIEPENSIEAPVETPIETPIQAPIESAIEISVEALYKRSVRAPIELSIKRSINTLYYSKMITLPIFFVTLQKSAQQKDARTRARTRRSPLTVANKKLEKG